MVASVLHTLEEKYGRKRDQFFLTSKQGFTSFDEHEECPRDLEVKEVISRSGGKLTERDFFKGKDLLDRLVLEEKAAKLEARQREAEAKGEEVDLNAIAQSLEQEDTPEHFLYSIHPKWLEHSIERSRQKLGVETIDCVYLSEPLEMGLQLYREPDGIFRALGKAFAFLEELVQ